MRYFYLKMKWRVKLPIVIFTELWLWKIPKIKKYLISYFFLLYVIFCLFGHFVVCFSPDSDLRELGIMEEIRSLHHCSQCNIFLQTDIQLQSHKEAHHPAKGNSDVKQRKTSQRLKDKDLESYERFQSYFSTITEEEIEVKAEILCCTSIDLDVEMR